MKRNRSAAWGAILAAIVGFVLGLSLQPRSAKAGIGGVKLAPADDSQHPIEAAVEESSCQWTKADVDVQKTDTSFKRNVNASCEKGQVMTGFKSHLLSGSDPSEDEEEIQCCKLSAVAQSGQNQRSADPHE